MKKILAIVLSLTLALSLAACTGSGASSSAPAPSAAPSASAVQPVSTASANSEYYYPVTLEVYNNARELVPYTFEQCPERTLVYGKNNVEIMLALGLEGYLQSGESADSAFTPAFMDVESTRLFPLERADAEN